MGEVYIVDSKKLYHRNTDFTSRPHYDYIIDSFDLGGVWNKMKPARTFQKKRKLQCNIRSLHCRLKETIS